MADQQPPLALIVDDDPLQRAYAAQLVAAESWRVQEAGDGLEALEAVKQAEPDFILMDVQMPVLDGISATRLIREEGKRFADLPIVACTSLHGLADSYHEAGFDAYLGKPIDDVALASLLDAWRPSSLGSTAKGLETAFSARDIGPLLHGLADQLDSLLSETDAVLADNAHRIAGLAGTLGFRELGSVWLSVSDGNGAAAPAARRMARATVRRIHEHLDSRTDH